MKAVQIKSFGDPLTVLEAADIPEPNLPGPNEALVGVEIAPVNRHDLLVVTNALGGEGFLDGCTTRSSVDGVVFGTGGLNGWHFRLQDGSVTKGDGRGRALEGKSI